MNDIITSAANPLAKRVKLLASRKHRRRENAFVVEGHQPVWRAVEAGWEIETLLTAPALLTNQPAQDMIDEQQRSGVPVARLSAELFTRLVNRDGPTGIAAILRTRTQTLPGLTTHARAVFVALHRIANPGNLGTIIRTADAVGAAGVILIGDTVDPYAPAAVKASMGSLFAVDIAHTPHTDGFLDWAAQHAITVLAADGTADNDHWHTTYTPPLAILLGSEREGLPHDLLSHSTHRLRIPMTGTTDSLNIAVAASIILYETQRHQNTQLTTSTNENDTARAK